MLFTEKTPFSGAVNNLTHYVQQASAAAATAARYTMSIVSASVPGLSRSLAEMKPSLISDIIAQATKHGSAILDLGLERGEVFIEIETNAHGRRVFKATNGMLEPAVWIESKKLRRQAWETKVAMSILEFIDGEDLDEKIAVEYGKSSTRWKGDHFSKLKEKYEIEGVLKKAGEKVTLQLPGEEEILTFCEPHAQEKAEVVLKYLYLWGRTPIEEQASKKWDFVANVFTGYVAVSGPLLAPWVGREPLVGESIDVLPPERLLPGGAGLQQNLMHGAAVCGVSMLTMINPKAAFVASLIILPSKAEAMMVDGQTSVEPRLIQEVRNVDAATRSAYARRTAPITAVNPLPSLTSNPGFPVTLPINLPTYFSLSNFQDNLDLTLSQTNGTLPVNWLSLSMGTISPQKYFNLGSGLTCYDMAISGTIAYVAAGTVVLSINLANLKNPIILGSYPIFATLICVQGSTVVVSYQGSNTVTFLDATNPAALTPKGTKTVATGILGMTCSGSKVYLNQASFTQYFANMTILDASNLTNVVQQSSVSWKFSNNGISYDIDVFGSTVYVSDGGMASTPQTRVFNTSNAFNSTQATIIPNVISNVVIKGSHLFVMTPSGLAVYDNIQFWNPIWKQTVYAGSNLVFCSMLLEGSFIYAFCGSQGVLVFDITDPLNPTITANFFTLNSAQGGKMCQNILIANDAAAGLSLYNTQERTLSGTSNTPGLYLPTVTATDDLGNSIVQTVPVHVGPIQVTPIPDQQVYVGNSTLFTVDPTTFQYAGATFNCTASLMGGLPLPSFIGFNPNSCAFLIAPGSNTNAQGTYKIQVTANDGYGGTASTTFNVVVPNRLPYVVQPLGNQTAYTGVPFQVVFSRSDFNDLDQDTLTLSAVLAGKTSLPQWLGFDPALFMFSGTPFGEGYYSIQVNAADGFGGVASSTFSITVPASPPAAINPPPSQTGSVGNPISFSLNSNTFFDADNKPLTYTTDPLPSFLTFNNVTRTFSGVPDTAGTSTIVVHATDPNGLSDSTSFTLTILSTPGVNPPVVQYPIENQLVKAGIPFSFTFPANTFATSSNGTLTYQATQTGSGAPLPTGLTFDSSTRTFTGAIQTPQTLSVSLRASDLFGGFVVDTFSFQAVASAPPIVLNALADAPATVGQFFEYSIPADTFTDLSFDSFTVSAFHEGDQPLPSWLKWDPKGMKFHGTPGLEDTNTYQVRIVHVNVWATSDVGSSKASFNINVGGDSFWALVIKYGLSFGGIALALGKLYRERAFISNFLNKEKYRDKEAQGAVVGSEFSYNLKLDFKDVWKIKVYHGSNLLSLPSGLIHDGNRIAGTPSPGSAGYYTIQVFDFSKTIRQEFDLIIRNSSSEAAPVKQVTTLEVVGDAIRKGVQKGVQTIRRKGKAEDKDNVEMGSF